MIPDRMWEMWATLLIFSLGVVPLLCHFTHISLTLLSLGKNGYLLCAWRTNFMWKYPCVACVTDIFGARAGFSLWVLAMSFLSVCWPFPPCLKGWDWCGDQIRILEWVAMPSSRGSYQSRDQIHISCSSCTAGDSSEPLGKPAFTYQLTSNIWLSVS